MAQCGGSLWRPSISASGRRYVTRTRSNTYVQVSVARPINQALEHAKVMSFLAHSRVSTLRHGQFWRMSSYAMPPAIAVWETRNPNPPKPKRRKRPKSAQRPTPAPTALAPARAARANHRANKAPKVSPSAGVLALRGINVMLPLAWYMEPLRKAMATPIRPPTASTRRRQRTLDISLPIEAFHQLLRPFDTGELDGLQWLNAEKTQLEPTSSRQGCKTYEYKLRSPSQLNRLWDMATWDRQVAGTPWRRGHGAQRLHLTQAAGRRGKKTMLLSSACGNVVLRLREYEDKLPQLKIIFSVMTLDGSRNHILWNQDYAPATRAALRKMATTGLHAMAANHLFPTPGSFLVTASIAQPAQSEQWTAPMLALLDQAADND